MAIQARHFRQWSAFLLLLALGGAAAWFLMPREWSQMQWEIPGTPSEYPLSQLLRPWLILLGCFLPALGMFLYNRSSILDKYVARTWFTAFIMCTAILTLIYIIGDFADNVGDLMNLDAPLMGTFRFYLSQLPMILNLILPYTLPPGNTLGAYQTFLILRNHRHAAVRTVPAPNQHPPSSSAPSLPPSTSASSGSTGRPTPPCTGN